MKCTTACIVDVYYVCTYVVRKYLLMSSSIGMGVVKGKMCLLPAFTLEWCFNLQQPHVFPNILLPPSHKAPPGVSWSTVPAGTVFHALGVARGVRVHRAPRSCGVTYRSKVSMASVRTYVLLFVSHGFDLALSSCLRKISSMCDSIAHSRKLPQV